MATIQGVYVALFGRPADPTGLAYFNSVTKNGADLSGIGDLASTQEYKDRFAGQNNTQIVNSIYQSLFGRDAEAAGLNFFVDALNKGTLNIKNIAIAILDGAQGADKTISSNKVAAADLYTKALDTPTEIGSYSGNAAAAQGRAFIAGVTTTVPTAAAVDASVAAMVGAGAVGNTVAITTGADTLSATVGITDTFGVTKFATNNNDTINATTADSLNAGDKIDGALGVDTVRAVLQNDLTLNGTGNEGNFKNIENLVVEANTGAVALDVTGVSGLQTLIHDGSLDSAAANTALNATGVALTTAVGVSGAVAGASSFTFKDAGGSSDAASLKLAAASGGTITVVNVETLNVSNTGTSVSTITDTSLKAVNVSGADSLGLTITNTATGLETVDASAFGGKLTYDASLNLALKTVTGGTGADTLTISQAHTNDLTINGGAGADTINVTATGTTSKALTLTGGADADQFVFAGSVANVQAVTAADFAKTLITISDFDKSADAIKVTVTGGTAGQLRDNILTAEQSAISAETTLLGAVSKAATYTDLNKASVFTYGSDTYIFVNNVDAGATPTLDQGDTLIKVTGIAAADLTATNFQLS